MITYTVQQDGGSWQIRQGALSYPGYRSEASASKAAIAVAQKRGLSGEESSVTVQGPDGEVRSIFTSDAESSASMLTVLDASGSSVSVVDRA